jgi:hypothetical protein
MFGHNPGTASKVMPPPNKAKRGRWSKGHVGPVSDWLHPDRALHYTTRGELNKKTPESLRRTPDRTYFVGSRNSGTIGPEALSSIATI